MGKKKIIEMIKDIEEYFVNEKVGAHEMLIILRDLENTAIVALVLGAQEQHKKNLTKE